MYVIYIMQYIDHTRPRRRESGNYTTPSYSIYGMAKHNRYAAHNHNSKSLKYDLASQQRTSLNQTNDHLDVRVYVQIRVIRHSLQTQSSRHFQIRTKHSQFSAKAERTTITNHFEIRLVSLAVTVIVE